MSDEPQNIYDDPGFFAGYSTLERFGAGWERAAEHADLLALLPDVNGRRVVDLGCGAGQLAHYLATRGAAEVIGVDVSERMLELARTQWAHPRVSYQRASIEEVSFAPARFDLVVNRNAARLPCFEPQHRKEDELLELTKVSLRRTHVGPARHGRYFTT